MSEKYDRDPSVPTSPRVRARALSATVAVVLRCTCKHGCCTASAELAALRATPPCACYSRMWTPRDTY